MATAAASKQAIRDYFEKMRAGDPGTADLLTDDVTWWVPPSSPLGGTHEGREAVVAHAMKRALLSFSSMPVSMACRDATIRR